MGLKAHYEQMYASAIERFRDDSYEIDGSINDPLDERYGITLLIRPSDEVKARITAFLNKIRLNEPEQYFYRESDMHITVMSIISCYAGFKLSQIDVDAYVAVINQCLQEIPPFTIHFTGLTASPSCLIAQGFMPEDHLNRLRERLREAFKDSALENSLDQRYAIKTAHATILRLQKPLADSNSFVDMLASNREIDFGSFCVDRLELVANDWYQRRERVQDLHSFTL